MKLLQTLFSEKKQHQFNAMSLMRLAWTLTNMLCVNLADLLVQIVRWRQPLLNYLKWNCMEMSNLPQCYLQGLTAVINSQVVTCVVIRFLTILEKHRVP